MFAYYVKVALHNTKRNKVLTALMVLVISVGIGACMTTLTMVHLLSGDPLPGRSQDIYYPQIDVNPDSKGREPFDVLDYRTAMDLWGAKRADQQTMVVTSQVKLRAPETRLPPLMLSMTSTTSDFFPMFDTPFQYGQGWSRSDDAKRTRLVVISSSLNERLFGGGNSVDKVIRLGDSDVRIVGVLAPWRPTPLFYKVRGGRFTNGNTSNFYAKIDDVFAPLSTSLEVNAGNFQPFTCWRAPEEPDDLENSPCVWVALWVRLDSAEKVSAYGRFLQDYAGQQKAIGRISNADNTRLRSLMQWLDFNRVVPSDVKLQAAMALMFLFICLSNVVGLLLTKFLSHSGEIGLRRALGATRTSVFAQCLLESALIGVVGGAGGLLLTLFGLQLMRSQPVAYADFVHLDMSMFLLTLALSIAASVLTGILPALRASLIPPASQLKLL